MTNKKSKILVAGGYGFLGSHLVKKLVAAGHAVTVLDNLSSGKKENLAGVDFEFINHDVAQPIELPVFDEIYHLASLASPVFYQKSPIETALSNAMGTYHLLQHAKKTKARFLFSSTSEVYGDPLQHPQKETYWGNVNPIGIRSCYDESKRLGETLTMDFHRLYKVKTHLPRIFNTYGPNMSKDDGRVIPNFIGQALKGEPITLYGDGSQTRSLCFVSDTVDGLIKLMASDYHEPVNIGNPQELTIKELAQKIIKLTGSTSKIEYRVLPEDDPHRRRPDISRAKKVLGWAPKVKLEDGLKATILYAY